MRKVLVLQHVAHEILGTLNPVLKSHKLRIRYVNFQRNPTADPDITGYHGLVILGGPMGVYDSHRFPHILKELKLIEKALKMDIPVLGICLGAQMIAKVLGARVSPHHQKEIGWHKVSFNTNAQSSLLFKGFDDEEMIFQNHGDSFDIPKSCLHLASSDICDSQAFSYGKKVYGLQFHIEVDEPMVKRWLKIPIIKYDIERLGYVRAPEEIWNATLLHINRSVELSDQCFRAFVDLFELPERSILLGSGHGKPSGRLGE